MATSVLFDGNIPTLTGLYVGKSATHTAKKSKFPFGHFAVILCTCCMCMPTLDLLDLESLLSYLQHINLRVSQHLDKQWSLRIL